MVNLIHIYPQLFTSIHKEKSSKKESTSTPLLLFLPFKTLTSTTHPSVTFSNELTREASTGANSAQFQKNNGTNPNG